jgi:glycosyltransferase involved in cell wall biosynthesis
VSTSSAPLVSVLTPSYNQATWLGDNLYSVRCQSYDNIEHVVMDGGSTDSSTELLSQAEGRVAWRSEPDRGQSDAINKAFRESSGEIIGWLNSDDAYFDRNVIQDVVAVFRSHPDVDVVYGHAAQTTGAGRIIQILWAPQFDRSLLGAVDFIVQPATFMRRAALTDPMLDEEFHFAMDYELWIRLAESGAVFRRLDRLLAIDRHQELRKSSTIKDVHSANLQRMAEMYPMRLGPEHEAERSAFYRRQRLRGARLIPGIRHDALAFSAPEDFKRGLWRRQVLLRRSTWPAEFR